MTYAKIIRQYLRQQRSIRRQQQKAGTEQVIFRPDYDPKVFICDMLMFELEELLGISTDN